MPEHEAPTGGTLANTHEFRQETAAYIDWQLEINEMISKAKRMEVEAGILRARAADQANRLYTEWQHRASFNPLVREFCRVVIQFDGSVVIGLDPFFGVDPGVSG